MPTIIQLGDIAVDVVRKNIKNLHLSVHPPTGRVRIAAPMGMNADAIRVFAISKLGWIKRQQRKLQDQKREPPREYLDRESHYLWGTSGSRPIRLGARFTAGSPCRVTVPGLKCTVGWRASAPVSDEQGHSSSRLSKSSARVNISRSPAGVTGHCSSGRSQ